MATTKAPIPKTINVNGHLLRVVLTHENEGPLRGSPRFTEPTRNAFGAFDYDRGVIAIRSGRTGMSRSQIRDTLLHEVIHAAVRIAGLHNHGRVDLSKHAEEERAVNYLATSLVDTLRRNPALARFLLEAD